MIAISELLLIIYRQPIYDLAARFMLYSAVFLTALTAIFGLIYSYSAIYSGLLETFLLWHMWLGIGTAFFTAVVLWFRENFGLGKVYLTSLLILVLMVNATGFFGGGLSFGPYVILPP